MWATYRLSKKADEAHVVATMLRNNSSFHKVEEEPAQVRFKEVPTTCIIGRQLLLAQLFDFMNDDTVGIIGLYGMAGVGKTVLLNKFHNDFISKATDVDLVVYIEKTSECSMDSIQKIIGDRLGLSTDWKGIKERAGGLHNALRKMNFVLIFDEIWEPLDLLEIGVPVPTRGSKSKIILMSRNEQVCNWMDAKRKIRVDCLPEDEAKMLFIEKIGGLNSEKKRHAKELVKRCGGLPLALVAVGQAMASKQTIEEWKHAITSLRIAPWQLFSFDTYLLKNLKSSYDHLPDDTLKICLLYCAMFPEGFSIPMEWITGYFIGEGFMDDDAYTPSIDELYDKGHDILGILKSTCLLERGDDDYHVKMHPMIRAMALWISSHCGPKDNRWIVCAEAGLEEPPPSGKWRCAEKISLMKNKILVFQEKPQCHQLKTLIIQQNPTSTICKGFFQGMPCLRVLDLSHTLLRELPSGMNVLSSLHYLDLSNTKIRSLPKEVGSLVNLRLLLLSNTPLQTVPNGLFRNLSALQVIHSDICSGDLDESSVGINFVELEYLNKLKALDITVRTAKSLQKLRQSHRLASCTRNLYIKDCRGLSVISLSSYEHWRNMNGMKCLWIGDCDELEKLFIDDDDDDQSKTRDAVAISSPTKLMLDPMPSIHHLPRDLYKTCEINTNLEQPVLPNVQSMVLDGLKFARIVRRGGSIQHLSSLTIRQCDGLEHLVSCLKERHTFKRHRTAPIEVFPNLRELYLGHLPNFKSLSSNRYIMAFPMLSVLTVVDCPKFIELKLVATALEEIRCTPVWSNGLKWEKESLKSTFSPLFKH